MGEWRRMYFLTPTFRPVGGVVKIFDYVNHARSLGFEPVIACPEEYKKNLPLFEMSRFSDISPENGVHFTGLEKVSVGPHDLAFLSWPMHYELVERNFSRWTRHEQVIFIVQNVRWANPRWINGYALRLLTRPMARVTTNDIVQKAIEPYLNERSISEVIRIGHDSKFFARERSGGFSTPLKVGYTTWKSAVGDQVAESLAGDPGFEFRAIREPVGWNELRRLYHWSDVFLATPLAEEGFYLPGLEAMAAGAVVISSDAGGNKDYCHFGKNCLGVGFEQAPDYVEALRELREYSPERIERFRHRAYEAVEVHTLKHERERFGEFMSRLTAHLDEIVPGSGVLDASRYDG